MSLYPLSHWWIKVWWSCQHRIWIRWMHSLNLSSSKLSSNSSHLANHPNGLCRISINTLFFYTMWRKVKSRSKDERKGPRSHQWRPSATIYSSLSVERFESKRQRGYLLHGHNSVSFWGETLRISSSLAHRLHQLTTNNRFSFISEQRRFLLIWNNSMVLATVIYYKSIRNEPVRVILTRIRWPICLIRGVSMSSKIPVSLSSNSWYPRKIVRSATRYRIWVNWSIKNSTWTVRVRSFPAFHLPTVFLSIGIPSIESVRKFNQWFSINDNGRRIRCSIGQHCFHHYSWCLFNIEWSWTYPCVHVRLVCRSNLPKSGNIVDSFV